MIFALAGSGFFLSSVSSAQRFVCWDYAFDFVAFYTSGRMVLEGDGRRIYDQELQQERQAQVAKEGSSECSAKAMAMEYFSASLVPFLPLAGLPPRLAFFLWSGVSMGLVAFSLWRIGNAFGVKAWPLWLWAFGSPFVYVGLVVGQLHGLLFLALTEACLSLRQQRTWRAGLWLSLLLMKPQFLPLYIALLLWKRSMSALGGLALGSLVFLGASVLLVGPSGMMEQASLITSFVQGEHASAQTVQASAIMMVNWQSLLTALRDGRDALWWGLWLGLTLLTAVVALAPWRNRHVAAFGDQRRDVLLVGLTAAALITGYNTQLHSVLLLAAPGLILIASQALNQSQTEAPTALLFFVEAALVLPSLVSPVVWLVFGDARLVIVGLATSQLLIVLVAAVCVLAALPMLRPAAEGSVRQQQRAAAVAAGSGEQAW
jgi:hypothetical protein